MDALRTAVEVHFLEWDVDEVIRSILRQEPCESKVKKEDQTRFENLFLERNNMFSTNIVSSINDYIETCKTSPQHLGRNKYSILAVLGHNMLKIVNGEPVCQYDSFLRWSEISAIVGEDMLAIPFLINADASSNFRRLSFDWKPFLSVDSSVINSFLKNGLSELHFHLKGSTTVFDLNWLVLMNQPLRNEEKKYLVEISDRWQLYSMVIKARALRLALYFLVFNKKREYNELMPFLNLILAGDVDIWSEDLQYHISIARELYGFRDAVFGVMDYAIPSNASTMKTANLIFVGERKLLYDCLMHIKTNDTRAETISQMLYAYLLVKNKFRQSLIQNNKRKGFSNFQKYDDRKDRIVNGRQMSYLAVNSTIQNQHIKDLEMRITPREKSLLLARHVKKLGKDINGSQIKDTQIGFILHFIKNEDCCKSQDDVFDMKPCRNSNVRLSVQKQANAIIRLIETGNPVIKTNPIKPFQIIGIDAAGSEFNCRAEAFAPAYRKIKLAHRDAWLDKVRDDRFCEIGRTFHVGEDYYDIVDGLRAIEESVLFLNLDRGDRIGHGVALGIYASQYYKERHHTLIINKQCLLDNVSWMLVKMDEYSIADIYGLRGRLLRNFDRLVFEVYKENVSYRYYYDSWLLRGDYPSRTFHGKRDELFPYRYNDYTPEIRLAHNNNIARELFEKYHYDSEVYRIGNEVEEIKIHPMDVKVVEALQYHLRKMIRDKEIAVECNPTSNLHITDVRRYADHPIIKMNAQWLKPNTEEMSVSINTDDQGIFATALEKEYTLMAVALSKEKDENGNPIYHAGDIIRWLENVRQMAYNRSFLRD